MVNKRLYLQDELEALMGPQHVYFQPPASVHLAYPCVIYNLQAGDMKHADDSVYAYTNRYELMFIYRKPNMEIVEKVMRTFPMCSISRIYVADNLYHYVFNLYY